MQPQTDAVKSKMKPSFRFTKPSRKLVTVALITILVIGGAVGVYCGYRWYAHRTPNPRVYSFSYDKTETVKLPGQQAGSGMALVRPIELRLSPLTPYSTQSTMSHTITKNKQAVLVAQIAIASVYAGLDLSSNYLKNLNTAMTDVKSPNHTGVIKPVKEFVNNRAHSGYNLTFMDPKPFTKDNIKANAWYMTFTGVAKDSKQASALPPLTGEVVLATGKSTFYYFMVDSITVNWQSNQKVWNQVINSLKIDQ